MKIKTDSSPPEDPKDPEDSLVFDIFKLIASPQQCQELASRYRKGIGWGDAKQALFEVIDAHFKEKTEKFNDLIHDKKQLDNILNAGATKARQLVQPFLNEVRSTIGL